MSSVKLAAFSAPIFVIAYLGLALCAFAQDPSPTQNPQAQPGQQSSAPPSASDANPAAAKPAKRVWTEDEVNNLRNKTGSDSISQTGNSNTPVPAPRPKTAAGTRDARWYHDQIARLQAKLPPIEGNIARLQAAISGKPTGDGATSSRPRGVKADDWATQLAQAQKQRDDILARIAQLRDEARQRGIAPNSLP